MKIADVIQKLEKIAKKPYRVQIRNSKTEIPKMADASKISNRRERRGTRRRDIAFSSLRFSVSSAVKLGFPIRLRFRVWDFEFLVSRILGAGGCGDQFRC